MILKKTLQVDEQCSFWKIHTKCQKTQRSSYNKFFSEHLSATEMKKKQNQIFMNKSVYFNLSILEISNIVMYEFWYDYVKPKYGEKAKLCYKVTEDFIVYIKT